MLNYFPRDPYIFYDERVPSEVPVDIHQKGALMIANAILSTWIGNGVTPKEWEDAWMTDGFLAYIQYLLVEQVFMGFEYSIECK